MHLLYSNKQFTLSLAIELVVLVLMAVGTVFVFSAGASVDARFDLQEFYNFTTLKQLAFFPLAILIMYAVSLMDYRRLSFHFAAAYKSLSPYLLFLSCVLLVLVLIPGVGVEKNFARRWLSLPLGPASLSFQPSELAKWSLVIFLAAYLDRYHGDMYRFFRRFVPACVIIGVMSMLVITQDFGSAFIIAALGCAMLFFGGCRFWHFLVPVPLVIPAFIAAIVTSPTRINRIKAFLNPGLDIPAQYQARQSLAAIMSGGLWGKGLGKGIMKYGHLPEDTTDFIFAVIAEEAGFFGAMCVLGLFVLLLVLGVMVISRCRDRYGRLLATGIVMTIALQAAINIGVVTVVLPTKGIGLPFISAGGSSLLISAAAVGVLVNIARSIEREPEVKPVRSKARKAREYR